MKKIVGYYNSLYYRIEKDGEEIYRAGNSPFDSQVYVKAKDGVGLEQMEAYCILTAQELAKEHNAKYIGVFSES